MEEVKVEINEDSFKVTTGLCPNCNLKMEKIIENKNLFDGTITFHIIRPEIKYPNPKYPEIKLTSACRA